MAHVPIRHKGKTAANWTSSDPVLLARQLGYETDTGKCKLGDGTTAWNLLSYCYYTISEIDTLLSAKASASALATHIADTSNPHAVTKAQVGLSNADNTSDSSKPVSTAQAAAIVAGDNASIATLRDGVTGAGDTLLKLYNLILSSFTEVTVANIAARNAYNVTSLPLHIFVTDDGDGNWALYKATTTGVGATFVKLSDPDLLNAVMSASQIKTAYESNADTNAFTNALLTKLNGIAANADATAAASESTAGKAEVATQPETDAGTDDSRFLTPLKFTNSSQLAAKLPYSGGNLTGALNWKRGSIASATTCDIGSVAGNSVTITGTTTITSFGSTGQDGQFRYVTFSGVLNLTHNATSLILPGGRNITTKAGDRCIMEYLGSGNWQCWEYTRSSGLSLITQAKWNCGQGADTVAASTTAYFSILPGPAGDNGTEGLRQCETLVDTLITRLSCNTRTTQSGSGTNVLTLRDDAADTALALTLAISAAAGHYTQTHSGIFIAKGSLVSVKTVQGLGTSAGIIDLSAEGIEFND